MSDNEHPEKGKLRYENTQNSVTTTVSIRGSKHKINGIIIGRVAIGSKFKKKIGYGNLSRLNLLLENYFKTFLPIWIWIIEHPEGLIVIDAGEIKRISDLDKYLSKESLSLKQFIYGDKILVIKLLLKTIWAKGIGC
jgi:hypothetical protein